MKNNFIKRILFSFFIIVILVLVNTLLLHNFFQNLVYKEFTSVGGIFTRKVLLFSRLSAGFINTKATIQKNAELTVENELLRSQLAELESLQKENGLLRTELNVAAKIRSPLILAQIFSVQKSAVSSTIMINTGSANGIKKGDAVISSGNVLAGIVDQVFKNTALVLLTDDPRVKISARIEDSNILAGTRGSLLGNMVLESVANTDDVKENETVVTSGLDGLPEALLIGRLTKIESPTGQLFKTVTAHMLFDLGLGPNLFVILK
jgi:rod shape-determining protein MreC